MRHAEMSFYYIYGEHAREVDPKFVHVERVSSRGRFHEGRVEPHSHPHLHQLSYWLSGAGRFDADGECHTLSAGTLTWMPSGFVHGFDVDANADAIVISMSHDFLSDVLAPMGSAPIRSIQLRSIVRAVPSDLRDRLYESFQDVEREYGFPAWGQSHAIAAHVRLIMVALARLAQIDQAVDREPAAPDALFARFLATLERNFRTRQSVKSYASSLGTTPYLLNIACREGARMHASQVARGRLLLEAKRLLLYTNMTVAEVAFSLGFNDPAHFGRMFRSQTGLSPAHWRERQRQEMVRPAS